MGNLISGDASVQQSIGNLDPRSPGGKTVPRTPMPELKAWSALAPFDPRSPVPTTAGFSRTPIPLEFGNAQQSNMLDPRSPSTAESDIKRTPIPSIPAQILGSTDGLEGPGSLSLADVMEEPQPTHELTFTDDVAEYTKPIEPEPRKATPTTPLDSTGLVTTAITTDSWTTDKENVPSPRLNKGSSMSNRKNLSPQNKRGAMSGSSQELLQKKSSRLALGHVNGSSMMMI